MSPEKESIFREILRYGNPTMAVRDRQWEDVSPQKAREIISSLKTQASMANERCGLSAVDGIRRAAKNFFQDDALCPVIWEESANGFGYGKARLIGMKLYSYSELKRIAESIEENVIV